MTVKFILSAAAVIGALTLGLPAMAADNGDMNKPMDKSMDKPMGKTTHHRHHGATHKEGGMNRAAAHHRMHGAMGADAKERAETEKLNQEQVQMNGTQH